MDEQRGQTDKVVSGFAFTSESEAKLAEQERQKIAYLDKRMDHNDIVSVLAIYKKALEDRVFRTPVGLEYLRELQGELKEHAEELGEEIPPIPVWTRNTPIRRRMQPPQESGNKMATFRLSLIMNIVMIIAIIAMFIITLNSDQPNILNYEKNIQNKYATWEQDLTQREQIIREKERELHIDTETSQN